MERLADEFPEPLTSKISKNNEYTGCAEGIKRKGDLEFDLQLEMALSATEAAANDNGLSLTVNDSSASLHQTPSKKLKTKKSGVSCFQITRPGYSLVKKIWTTFILVGSLL